MSDEIKNITTQNNQTIQDNILESEKIIISNEIIDSFILGEEYAFRYVYKSFSVKVYRFCLKVLSEREAAKDATQDTFIKIYENRKQFSGQNLKAWVYTIAKNCCITALRRKRTHIELNENIEIKSEDYIPADSSLISHIEKALNQLPFIYKEAIILREYEDYTYQEIANLLQIDISAAKLRVFRARGILRKILEPVQKEMNEHR